MQKDKLKVFCVLSSLVFLLLSGVPFPLHAGNFQPDQSQIKANTLFIPQTVQELYRLKARSDELQRWIGAKAEKCIMEWSYSEKKNRLVPKNWIFLVENEGLIVGLIATDPVTDNFSWRTTWDINRHIKNIRAIFSFQPMALEGASISVLNSKSSSDYDFQKTKLLIIRGKHYWIVPKKGADIETFLIAPIENLNEIRAFSEFKKNLEPKGIVSFGENALSTFEVHPDLNKIILNPTDWHKIKNESQVTIQATNTDMNGEVPIYYQGSTDNCWAYSLAMLHQWWSPINLGTGDSQVQDIRDYIGLGPNDGATLDDQHQIMAHWPSVDSRFENYATTGFGEGKAFAVGDPTWYGTDPKTWLAFEAPVLASIDSSGGGPDSDVDHMVVITGYDDASQTVYINNPWGFADTYSYSDFNQKYWGAIWEEWLYPIPDKRRGMVCGMPGDNDYAHLSSHSINIPNWQMYDDEKVIVENIGLSVSGDHAGGGWDNFNHYNYRNTFNSSLGWYLEPVHVLIDSGVTATPVNLGNWWTYTPSPPSRTIEFSEQDLSPGGSLSNASFYVKVDPAGRFNQMRIFYSWTVWDHNDRTHYQAGRLTIFDDRTVKDGTFDMRTPMRIYDRASGDTYIQVDDDDTTPPVITNPYSNPVSPVDGYYSGDITLYASATDSQSGVDYVKFKYKYGSGPIIERNGTAMIKILNKWYCTIPENEWTLYRGNTIYWTVEASDEDNDCAGDSSISYSQEEALVLSPGVIQYTLTISAGEGGTTDPAPGLHIHESGADVEVEAFPESGNNLSHWTGDVPTGHENDNPIIITMDGDKSITALFSLIPFDSNYYIFDGHDFDGNGSSDVSVFRPSTGRWYIKGVGNLIWGTSGDTPVNGDYNGDEKTDIAVWRRSNGRWYIKGLTGTIWGTTGDIPVPGNYDGDVNDTTEIAVWRPSNGRWYIKNVGGSVWGTAGDIPVPGDYNGDGTTEIAVWRPSNGRWYIKGIGSFVWGTSGDSPVPGDYNGDGTTEIAVWRPSNGRWYIMGLVGTSWGTVGDIPAPGDYDGDGITDIAVWRPSNGRWYIKGIGGYLWGMLGDIPLVR